MSEIEKNLNEVGPVKRANKSAKNIATVGTDTSKHGGNNNPSWRPKPGAPVSDRVKKHLASRGVKKKAMAESTINNFKKAIRSFVNEEDITKDTMSKAGGNWDEYNKIKASKGGTDIERIKGQRKAALAARKASGKATKGPARHDAPEDQQGPATRYNTLERPKSTPNNNPNFKKGKLTKPMPLNPKGKAHPGKNPAGAKGKTINTSRGSGQEGEKAYSNEKMFNKLVQKLSGR